MGLFDNVTVEREGYEGRSFQTKDFPEPYMENYVIRADGRLIRKRRWWLEKDDPEGDTDMNFHGILNFYHGEDYYAKFTDGTLISITPTDPRNPSTTKSSATDVALGGGGG